MNRLNITCASLLALTLTTTAAFAATCGDTGAGFEGWKTDFATEAKKAGVKKKGPRRPRQRHLCDENNRKLLKAAFAHSRAFAFLLRINKSPQHV